MTALNKITMPTIDHNTDGSITVSVTIPLTGNMMEMENTILDAVNDVGCMATGEALKRFDTNGNPIIREGVKLYSKSKGYHFKMGHPVISVS